MTHVMVAGTSEPQDFQLLNEGVALVGTGFTLGIEFASNGTYTAAQVTALAGVIVTWLSQATGTVRASTGISALPIGLYPFRFTLTDSGSKKGYVPNLDASPNLWRVVKV